MAIVDLELFKKHVRADDFTDDDAYMLHLLDAAEQAVVTATNRTAAELTAGGGGFPGSAAPCRAAARRPLVQPARERQHHADAPRARHAAGSGPTLHQACAMRAGPLRYRITLQRPVQRGRGASGAACTAYEPTRTVHAERVRHSGRRIQEAGELFADYSVRWRIRDAHPVAEGWRVAEQPGGTVYTVVAIEPDRALGMLTLICERLNP